MAFMHKISVKGAVSIRSQITLEEASKALSDILQVKFELDPTERFNEYPAYIARVLGLELALLGNAEDDDPDTDYVLQVDSIQNYADDASLLDLSDFLVEVISTSGRLVCD